MTYLGQDTIRLQTPILTDEGPMHSVQFSYVTLDSGARSLVIATNYSDQIPPLIADSPLGVLDALDRVRAMARAECERVGRLDPGPGILEVTSDDGRRSLALYRSVLKAGKPEIGPTFNTLTLVAAILRGLSEWGGRESLATEDVLDTLAFNAGEILGELDAEVAE